MCFHEWESQGCTERGSPKNKWVRPGPNSALLPETCRSLEEGRRFLWKSGVPAGGQVGRGSLGAQSALRRPPGRA